MTGDSKLQADAPDHSAAVGTGRFRVRPRVTLAMLRQGTELPEEPITPDAESRKRTPYRMHGFPGLSPDEQEVVRQEAKAWREVFYKMASPDLLEWLKGRDAISEYDVYPSRSWEIYKASKPYELRVWLTQESREVPKQINETTLAPVNGF